MIRDDWTFYIIDPYDKDFKETTQQLYNDKYNESFECLLNELFIPNPTDILKETPSFIYFINCEKENNIINKDDSYGYKFFKTKFFETKNKLIFNKMNEYYNKYNIHVKKIYATDTGYNIELEFMR